MITTERKAWLLLQDGTLFEGKSFGAEGSSIGEVIFSTSMAGYQEVLSDPTYYGQILTQTFPLIGNYGVNSEDMSADRCFLHGYIVREWCDTPSNFRCEGDIDKFLKEQGVIGLYGIDTRHLTKILREKGTMNGLITTEAIRDKANTLKKIAKYTVKNAIQSVTEGTPLLSETSQLGPQAELRIGILNLGCCEYLKEEMLGRDCDTVIFNPNQPASTILENKVDGIILSEGPGDPAEDKDVLKTIEELIDDGIPMMGIGLGHQMLALANDMKCRRMLHGHRGASQPVIDTLTGKTYITSQNHGYAVNEETVDEDVANIRYKNANDKSCEGLVYKDIPALSVQFRPQGDGSDQDTAFLYDEFVEMVKRQAAR